MQSGIQTALTLGLVLVFGACKRPNQRDPAVARRAQAVPTGRPGASMSATPAAEVVPATDRGCGMAGFCWMRPALGAASIPSVWSSSADNAWAVDASGRILHYDGRSWSVALRPVTSGLSRVWGTSARDVWAVGASGVALHFDGQQWFQVSTGISFDLQALWGVGTTEVWAGGEGGLLRWDGRAWSMVDSPAPSRVTALWSPDAQTLWAVNEMGEVHRHHNGVWGRMTPPEANAFVAIAGRSDRDVWIAGSREGMGTRVYHWNGQAWQTTTVEAVVDGPRWDIPIEALAARGEGVWAGGMFTLQRWHTGQWQSDEGAELALTMRVFVRSVEALWAGEDHLWAAGQEGLRGMLLLKRGAAWQETTGLREGGPTRDGPWRPTMSGLQVAMAKRCTGMGRDGPRMPCWKARGNTGRRCGPPARVMSGWWVRGEWRAGTEAPGTTCRPRPTHRASARFGAPGPTTCGWRAPRVPSFDGTARPGRV